MMTMQLDNAWTLVAAMATILLGTRIHRVLPMLDRANIPPAVSAGLLMSVLLALLRWRGVEPSALLAVGVLGVLSAAAFLAGAGRTWE